MEREQVLKIRELFEAAVAQAPPQREAFLDRECAGDPGLRDAVDRMLAADAESGRLLDSPVLHSGAADRREGERIGDYRILSEIGTGGMGTVYLAAQEHDAQRHVAIKIVSRRAYSAGGLRRFAQERAILAGLDHPNIARFIDGGSTDDGHPYFVMEYVGGKTIRQYCSDNRLTVDQRLGLFRQVCSAVQYSHQNLIIHRDLKPGNILVTPDGRVKLLDFGIAKLLPSTTEDAETLTLTGARLMTPDYASPEQITGSALSTLSDVYSLGVILYELLTDRLPHVTDRKDQRDIMRSICEDQPPPPSATTETSADSRRQLEGELDNIVLKALRKEPERRYQSAEQFNDDIRRYLEHLPVLAQKDTLLYLARKFVLRHRTGVGAAAAILVLLMAGIVSTTLAAHVARQERSRAEQEAAEARKQKLSAETQSRMADQQRLEAQQQRQTAERRRAEMEQLANKVLAIYGVVQGARAPSELAEVVAQQTHESLDLLARAGIGGPAVTAGLASTAALLSVHQNLQDRPWQVPKFWYASESVPGEYTIGIDHERVHKGNSSLSVRSAIPDPKGVASVGQSIQMGQLRGQRVRLNAFVLLRNVGGYASLWLRSKSAAAARGSVSVESDPLRDSIAGTASWTSYSVFLEIPEDAESIDFGISLYGSGSVWADDFSFEKAPRDAPVNLDFRLREGHE